MMNADDHLAEIRRVATVLNERDEQTYRTPEQRRGWFEHPNISQAQLDERDTIDEWRTR